MEIAWSRLMLYNANEVQHEVETKPGVYRLSTKLADGELYVFYVGEAENLRLTLFHHLGEEEEDSCIKKNVKYNICYLKFPYLPDPLQRKGIYKYVYEKFKPECNKSPPPGVPIEVNLS